jgi:hypothetical protein
MRRITIRYVGQWKKSRGFPGGRAASVSGGLSRATGCPPRRIFDLPTRDLTVLFVRLASGRADGPGAPLKQHEVEKHLLTTGWQATRGTWTAVPPEAEATSGEPRATGDEPRATGDEPRATNDDSRPSAVDCHCGSSAAPQPSRPWGIPRPLARPPLAGFPFPVPRSLFPVPCSPPLGVIHNGPCT